VTTSTLLGLIEDIVISIVVFLVVSLRNTDGTVIQGANSQTLNLVLANEVVKNFVDPQEAAILEPFEMAVNTVSIE
jgi:hypothetical protein